MSVSKEQVIRIITRVLNMDMGGFSDIKENSDLRDFGLDSITSIDIIVALENEYEIAIEDEDLLIENFNTLDKISKLIGKYTDITA